MPLSPRSDSSARENTDNNYLEHTPETSNVLANTKEVYPRERFSMSHTGKWFWSMVPGLRLEPGENSGVS